MRIFLETANTEEIQKGLEFGIVDGVTTNPSLIARKKRKFRQLIKKQFLKDWEKIKT